MQFKNLVINELMQGLNHLLHNVKILWHLIFKELLDAIKKKRGGWFGMLTNYVSMKIKIKR